MGPAAMTKAKARAKKTVPSKPLSGRKTIAVTIKGGPEWKDWIDGLARHCRLDVAKVFDLAVVQFAKGQGYDHEAPER
jgi:hypothetical protein